MSYFSNPQKTEAGQRQSVVSDAEVYDLLNEILLELQRMNIQLELITGEEVKDEEIDSA